jgi:hypothetical protein
MKKDDGKGVRSARREIEALEAIEAPTSSRTAATGPEHSDQIQIEALTSSRAGIERMPDKFYQWLVAELENEVERAQDKLREASDWLATCEGAARQARAARFAAAREEGGLAGEKTIKCQLVAYRTWRDLAMARDVLVLRQAKVREMKNRLARARVGVADAEQVIVETWSKNGSVHVMGPIEPAPTVQAVQDARDRAGISVLIHPTRQVANSWLGPTNINYGGRSQ